MDAARTPLESRLRPMASILPERVRARLAFALAYSTELSMPAASIFLREWSTRGRAQNRDALAQSVEGQVRAMGLTLDPRTDPGAIREVLLDREYDWPGFVPTPGSTVLDIGAQHGEFALLCAVTRRARVLAFEPVEGNCAVIEENLRRNGRPAIEVFPIALGASDGELEVYRYDTMVVRDPGRFPARARRIPQRRLDSMEIGDFASDRSVIMKIDVEGFERDVLDGAAGFIGRVRPRLIIETDPRRASSISEFLARASYSVVHRRQKTTGELLFAAPATGPSEATGP